MQRPEPAEEVDPSDEEFLDEEDRPRRWSEGVLGETVRRAVEKGIEAGIGTMARADSVIRDTKLPREIVSMIFSQVDDTKNALVRGVAKEVRDFLEATDIAKEFYNALTKLSFEVKTEIRFIPNDKGDLKPKFRASARPKRRSKRPKAKKQSTASAPPSIASSDAPADAVSSDE